MAKKDLTRRQFLAGATATATAPPHSRSEALVPALLGGTPVRTRPFPAWPVWGEADEKAIVPVLRSGVWSRSRLVTEAEKNSAEAFERSRDVGIV